MFHPCIGAAHTPLRLHAHLLLGGIINEKSYLSCYPLLGQSICGGNLGPSAAAVSGTFHSREPATASIGCKNQQKPFVLFVFVPLCWNRTGQSGRFQSMEIFIVRN